jgi:hypothetical protein
MLCKSCKVKMLTLSSAWKQGAGWGGEGGDRGCRGEEWLKQCMHM